MESAATILRTPAVDLIVWLHTANDPPQEEWDRHVALILALKEERNGDLSRIRQFVVSEGASPNMSQRKHLAQIFGAKPTKLAVVTLALSNPIKRGVASVLSWMNPGFRIFRPEDGKEALAHVDAPAGPLWKALVTMQEGMPPVPVLAALGRALGQPPIDALSSGRITQ